MQVPIIQMVHAGVGAMLAMDHKACGRPFKRVPTFPLRFGHQLTGLGVPVSSLAIPPAQLYL